MTASPRANSPRNSIHFERIVHRLGFSSSSFFPSRSCVRDIAKFGRLKSCRYGFMRDDIAKVLVSRSSSFSRSVSINYARLEADTFSIALPTLALIKTKTDTAVPASSGRFSLSLFSRFVSSFPPRVPPSIYPSIHPGSLRSSLARIFRDGTVNLLSGRIVNETKIRRAR